MKYAIVQFGGKQIKVSEGDVFEIERQQDLKMDVLAFSDGKNFFMGEPVLKNVNVQASLVEEKKGKKIVVARYKSKSRYRRKKGHRQPLSVVKIDSIKKGSAQVASEKKAKKTPTKKKTIKETK